jgi:dolichyl-phosphate-mannose-protein mannosyltransferase
MVPFIMGRRIVLSVALGTLPIAIRLLTLDVPMAIDLHPRGDALEYAMSAASLASGEGYSLRLGKDAYYPPTFTPGFPLLLAGWYKAVGTRPETAYLVSVLCAGVVSFLAFWIACNLGGVWAGVFASLAVAFSTLHTGIAGRVMSDVASTSFLLLSLLFLVSAVRQKRSFAWAMTCFAGAGLAAGWATCIRPVNFLVVAAAALALVTRRRVAWRQRFLALSAFLLFSGAGLLPTLYFSLQNHGDPLANGYALWSPEHCRNPGSAYCLENLWNTMDSVRWPNSNGRRYLESISGWNRQEESLVLYGMTMWFLAAIPWINAFRGKRRGEERETFFLGMSGLAASFIALHYVFYFWQDPRFLHPVLPVVSIWGGLGLAHLLSFKASTYRHACILLAVLAAAAALWPGAERSYDKLRNGPKDFVESEMSIAERFEILDGSLEDNAVVITSLDCLLVERLLIGTTDRTHVPLTLSGAGSHLMSVYIHNIPCARWSRSTNGEDPRPRPLFQPEDIGESSWDWVKQEVESGSPVYLVSDGVDFSSREMMRLRSSFQLEESEGVVGLTKLLPRSRDG